MCAVGMCMSGMKSSAPKALDSNGLTIDLSASSVTSSDSHPGATGIIAPFAFLDDSDPPSAPAAK